VGWLQYQAKTLVAMHPRLALPVARVRAHGEVVTRDTDIVIEGFPRTGSSFAVAALRRAHDRPVRIAHHVHAPAQVIAAVRWGIPALVLIREPEDSILSMVIRNRGVGIAQAIRGYRRFYTPLMPMRDNFVTATFEAVTTDFGKVVVRINDRFGTRFLPFEHTAEEAHSILMEIEEDYLTRNEPGERFERIVARPSELRQKLKEELRPRYRDPELARVRSAVESLYHRFLDA
jgi:hypothetical protein